MKKSNHHLSAFLVLLLLSSCEFSWETHSSSTSSIGTAYSGTTVFKDDTSGIKSISPKGFFMFYVNDNSIEAKSLANGKITYSIDNGTPDTILTHKGLVLIHEAIKYGHANGTFKKPPYIISGTPNK